MSNDQTYTAFADDRKLTSGSLEAVILAAKTHSKSSQEPVLIFEDTTGRQVDFDLRQPVAQIVKHALQQPEQQGPGRPRLGVVAREVTLLPRHWDWLADQRGGASGALRRLVDEARNNETPDQSRRRTAAATGRVMTVLAGNRPGFEEAYRALDAGNRSKFTELVAGWPEDVRQHLITISEPAFSQIGVATDEH